VQRENRPLSGAPVVLTLNPSSMRLPNLVLACSALLLSAACGRKKPAPVPAPAAAPAPPAENLAPLDDEARIYYDDAAVAFTDSVRLTIRDVESWRNIWNRATAGQASAPPLPDIDFRRQMVLLVGAGRLRSGDEIHVDSVGTRKGVTIAVVRTTVECPAFPAVAYPFEIVRVKRSDQEVRFVERKSSPDDCR
jgi:hypothetical protein